MLQLESLQHFAKINADDLSSLLGPGEEYARIKAAFLKL
jgi:hypothetical protein